MTDTPDLSQGWRKAYVHADPDGGPWSFTPIIMSGGAFAAEAWATCHFKKHLAPAWDCKCGWNAFLDREDAEAYIPEATGNGAFLLEVEGAGRVIEHELGWRSEWQRVLSARYPANCHCDSAARLHIDLSGNVVAACDDHAPIGSTPTTPAEVAERLGTEVLADPDIAPHAHPGRGLPDESAVMLIPVLITLALTAVGMFHLGVSTDSTPLVAGGFAATAAWAAAMWMLYRKSKAYSSQYLMLMGAVGSAVTAAVAVMLATGGFSRVVSTDGPPSYAQDAWDAAQDAEPGSTVLMEGPVVAWAVGDDKADAAVVWNGVSCVLVTDDAGELDTQPLGMEAGECVRRAEAHLANPATASSDTPN